MNILINFSTPSHRKAQVFNSKTALKIGGFGECIEYSSADIDTDFYNTNRATLDEPRGAGYWLWKPYFILKTLKEIDAKDVLMYADSASHFINSAAPILDLPKKFNQDIIPFELELKECDWTKRDAFELTGLTGDRYENTPQRLASFMVVRKTPFSLKFFSEYLMYCCNPNILTDLVNISRQPNAPNFQLHRHDQSIFSLLTKKYNLHGFRDPSQWGNDRIKLYSN